jgi:hypothetical protein
MLWVFSKYSWLNDKTNRSSQKKRDGNTARVAVHLVEVSEIGDKGLRALRLNYPPSPSFHSCSITTGHHYRICPLPAPTLEDFGVPDCLHSLFS